MNIKSVLKVFYVFFLFSLFSCNSNSEKNTIGLSESSVTSDSISTVEEEILESPKYRYNTFHFNGSNNDGSIEFFYLNERYLYIDGMKLDYRTSDDGKVFFNNGFENCVAVFFDAFDYRTNASLSLITERNKRARIRLGERALLPSEERSLVYIYNDNSEIPIWNRRVTGKYIVKDLDNDITLQNKTIKYYQETITKTKSAIQYNYKNFSRTKEEHDNKFLDSARVFSEMQAEFDSFNEKYSNWMNTDNITVSLEDCKDPDFLTKVLTFNGDWDSFYYKKYAIWCNRYNEATRINY